MPKITLTVKTQFGDIQVSGETPEELLSSLDWLTQEYVAQLNEKVSGVVSKQALDHLKEIVEMRRDGPILVCKEEISHYEAIGLLLYAMKGYQATGKELKAYLNESGRKVIVPARLHEMVKKGVLFRPEGRGSIYKLTAKGVNWVEKEVLPPIREKQAALA
jgi:phosphoglycerate-specific signal transduction histidine kinase